MTTGERGKFTRLWRQQAWGPVEEKPVHWGPPVVSVAGVFPMMGREKIQGQRGEWGLGPRWPWRHVGDFGKHSESTGSPLKAFDQKSHMVRFVPSKGPSGSQCRGWIGEGGTG